MLAPFGMDPVSATSWTSSFDGRASAVEATNATVATRGAKRSRMRILPPSPLLYLIRAVGGQTYELTTIAGWVQIARSAHAVPMSCQGRATVEKGFVWCEHCGSPHLLRERGCPSTGR